jgi:hypothetical protein
LAPQKVTNRDMNVGEFEDLLVFHANEVSPATDLVVEVQTVDGASVTVAVTDVGIGGDRLVIHAAPLPR